MRSLRTPTLPLLFLLLSLPCALYSQQAPAIEWQKCYGGTDEDMGHSIILTSDGGYVIAGNTYSRNGDVTVNHGGIEPTDVWIFKLTSSGAIEWQTSFGGNADDGATSIIQTFDGGYIVAGYTASDDGDISGNHGRIDALVIKYNSLGKIEWQKCFGSTMVDWANSIVQTFDSGYAITGFTNSSDGDVSGYHKGQNQEPYDAWIVKLNSVGNLEWQKCLGGSDDDKANSIIQTFDSGFAVAGFTRSMDGDVSPHRMENDTWVIKVSSRGSIEWQKNLGDSGIGSVEGATAIIQTYDSGYVVAGSQIFKLNPYGDIIWQNNEAYGNSIIQTSDNNLIAGAPGAAITMITSSGKIEWYKIYGGSNNDGANSIIQTSDGSYAFAGYTNSNDGDVSLNHGSFDVWVVKLSASSNTVNSAESTVKNLSLSTYPNPVTRHTTLQYYLPNPSRVEICIYNILGERLKQITVSNQERGHHECGLDLSGIPSGTYCMSLKACESSETTMIVKSER